MAPQQIQIQIQIVSTDIVKPSSPTPVASKTHKLSFIDQISPPIYLPLIFFYQNDDHKSKHHDHEEEISRRLKQSLSNILTIFYPLAGTVNQNSHVDCNDRGAEFVEARIHSRLSQFLQNPDTEVLLPADTSSYEEKAAQLLVKISFFDCGGVAVAVCFPHKIGDFSSFATFMNDWAATCRSGEASGIIRPRFDLAHLFPPIDLPSASGIGYSLGMSKDKIMTKRLVFDRIKLEKLREKASSDEITDPSKEEAVSAFLWRSFIEANKSTAAETTLFTASLAVNLRPIAVPPLPDQTIGNWFTSASAAVMSSSSSDESVLVSKLRAAVRAVEDNYIDYNVIKEENNIRLLGDLFRSGNCYLSSWWRFPVEEVDFGWGKPVWVCIETMPLMNLVIMMDTPSGDGVEAWINVPSNDFFQIFQDNYDNL